jgi:hypothetical protein
MEPKLAEHSVQFQSVLKKEVLRHAQRSALNA